MKGAYTRDIKLRSVRMTLSKLDAKYSKSSVVVDEEDSSDFDGGDLVKPTHAPTSVMQVPQVEPSPASKVAEKQQINSSHSSESSLRLKLKSVTSSEQGSPPAEDKTSLDADSSIESVKTESILGFNNVHSMSSLADSLPRSDNVEQKMSIDLSMSMQKSQPVSSCASAGIHYESIISNKGRNKSVHDTSSSTSSLESIQKLSTQSLEKSAENTIDPLEFNLGSLTKEEPLGFPEMLCPANIMPVPENDGGHTAKNSVRNTSKEEAFHHCKCNKLLKLKRKSIAVQTQFKDHQEVESSVLKHNSKGNILATEYSVNTPGIKAIKLPLFLNDVSATSKVGLGKGQRPEVSSSIENELSQLISHHLYLTKEFLERQHRMYLANCRAVQLLEKGYNENKSHGI